MKNMYFYSFNKYKENKSLQKDFYSLNSKKGI